MKFYNYLNDILGSDIKIEILRFLCLHSDHDFTGRELGKAINYSHVNCHVALKNLTNIGLVVHRKVGHSILFSINKNHYLFKIINIYFNEEIRIYEVLKVLILKYIVAPKSLILFGSLAKKTETHDSDIDLIIIKPTKKNYSEKEIDILKQEVRTFFGNEFSPIIITQEEFKKKFKEKMNPIHEAATHGRVLYGLTISELL